MSISEFMTHKHRECDQLFSDAENSVVSGNWSDAGHKWHLFKADLEDHLNMEENVLFPQFEEATGMTQGPTMVMRMEHQQMRSICSKLEVALKGQDKESFLGLSESLMIFIQQHNMKEEQMLYPMADRALVAADQVIADMESSACA
ncbi:hemerythrin domain-containing protein [Litoribrevibacter euphylliae]|uniref:Hemerythrin domain-containing protein n=1 Tax=Litoribrevibacter euphylliae TaxID=1834034 RepID=A0ABV7HHJ0_9GAMM